MQSDYFLRFTSCKYENNFSAFLKLEDEDIISKIKKTKNPILFGVLYDRYVKTIYNKCFSFVNNEAEAEDLTQDLFLKLYTKLDSYHAKSKFSTWLYAFTYNFCVSYIQKDKFKKIQKLSAPIEYYEYHLFENDNSYSEKNLELDIVDLKQALNRIPLADKKILLLKYQDDVTIKELKVLLNISDSAAKMRLKRAKIRLIETYNKL